MKSLPALFFITALAMGCSRSVMPGIATDNVVSVKISFEDKKYLLVIEDQQFHNWFAANAKPLQFYSESFYENQNRKYAESWNELYLKSRGLKPFDNYISYDAGLGYGTDFNYQLFWYFKYIEGKYGSSYNFPSKVSL